MTPQGPGVVYARLLTVDDPDADERLAQDAAATFAHAGLAVRVEMPPIRGGMGAGGGAPIDGWIYVVLSVAGGATGGVLSGFLGAMGADLWTTIKSAVRDLRRRPRPASRAIVLLTMRNAGGGEVRILIGPDDPLDRIDLLRSSHPRGARASDRAVMVRWNPKSHRWEVDPIEGPES